MTCPNCRGETHRFAGRLVCSAGCGWSQDEATPAACTCGPRASHAVRCERCGLPPGVPAPAAPRVEPRRPQVGDRFEHYKGDPLGFVTLVAVSAPAATCFDNDCRMRWDDGSEQDYHTSFLLGEYGSAWRPAPPATQGAAAAGPACDECGDRGGRWDEEAIDQWYPCRTCETDEPAPLPPASEPPRSYSPSCAGTCWPPCAHHGVEVALFMYKDRTRVLVQLAEVTAAKAALEAARDNAVRERDEARTDRTRALALATEHLEARAALEVQLRDERTAHEATRRLLAAIESCRDHFTSELGTSCAVRDALSAQLAETQEALANMTEERDMQQFHARDVAADRDRVAEERDKWKRAYDLEDRVKFEALARENEAVTERDALAVQLAGVVRVLESAQAHAERTLGATTAEKDRALDWICGQAKSARAALAASGPVKEGE